MTNAASSTPLRFLRMPDVLRRTALSRSQLYELRDRDDFPRPVKTTGLRSVAWVESEINDWIAARIAERDA